MSVLTQSLLVSVRVNKAGKLRRASGLSGAAYRHLMGQRSQSVLTNAHYCTASLILSQTFEMEGRGMPLVFRGKLKQIVSPTRETESEESSEKVTPCMCRVGTLSWLLSPFLSVSALSAMSHGSGVSLAHCLYDVFQKIYEVVDHSLLDHTVLSVVSTAVF